MRFVPRLALLAVLPCLWANAQTPKPTIPQDQPFGLADTESLERLHALCQPYVDQARKSYPDARRRFLAGLPKGDDFYVVTRVHDRLGREEQVFVLVRSIRRDLIKGELASDVLGASGLSNGQPYQLREGDIIDWVITHPDGTEEGNAVGRFLDQFQAQPPNP